MQLPYDGFVRRRIYLVRHGHALGEGEKSARYATDISLTERGMREAEAMRDFLRDVPFDEAWSSDISRTHQTAQIILQPHGLHVTTSPAYREIAVDMSSALRDRSGEAKDLLARFAYQMWRSDIATAQIFDTGDSFSEFFGRVHAAMQAFVLGATGHTLLLAAHSAFNRCALAWASGAPLAHALASFEQDTGCLNILDIDVDLVDRRIVRRHVRLANFTPLDPTKRETRFTDGEESAEKVAHLLKSLAAAG